MHTVFPYQVRGLIGRLTDAGDALDEIGNPNWHTLGSAAACLEHLLAGRTPDDIDTISASLKALVAEITYSGSAVTSIFMALAIIDGHRLGLLNVQPEVEHHWPQPIWIGIDMGTGQRHCFGGPRHA